MNKSVAKNIFYPLIVLSFVFITSILISSCSMTFIKVDISFETLNQLVFSNRKTTHLLSFENDSVLERKDDSFIEWTYSIDGRRLNLVSSEENKTLFVLSESKIFDETTREYLYEVVYE